jgi:hypothetical protein
LCLATQFGFWIGNWGSGWASGVGLENRVRHRAQKTPTKVRYVVEGWEEEGQIKGLLVGGRGNSRVSQATAAPASNLDLGLGHLIQTCTDLFMR